MTVSHSLIASLCLHEAHSAVEEGSKKTCRLACGACSHLHPYCAPRQRCSTKTRMTTGVKPTSKLRLCTKHLDEQVVALRPEKNNRQQRRKELQRIYDQRSDLVVQCSILNVKCVFYLRQGKKQ